jgi:hypothetical protein
VVAEASQLRQRTTRSARASSTLTPPVARRRPRLRLHAYGRARFLIQDAPPIMSPPETNKMEFLRRPDGTIGWLRYGIFTVYPKRA